MLLPQYQQVIQAFSTDRTDETFANGIGFGRTKGCRQDLDLGAGGNGSKLLTLFLVIVTNEGFGTVLEGCRLAERLGNPTISRVTSDSHMNDAA
jgi:hypothetical protein